MRPHRPLRPRALLLSAAVVAAGLTASPSLRPAASQPLGDRTVHAPGSPGSGGEIVEGRRLHLMGRVTDATSGRALESAQLFVPGTSVGAITNRQGRYLVHLPADLLAREEIEIRVELIGYAARSELLRPAAHRGSETVTIDFALEATALRMQELVVTGVAAGAPTLEAERSRHTRDARGVVGEAAVELSSISATRVDALPHRPFHRPAEFNREQYEHITENTFRSVADHPLSTFSIDVDRASYSNVRRFLLRENRLPPADAVQIEEMVNYFAYDYAMPDGPHPIGVTTELGTAPWEERHHLLRVGIASPRIETEALPPSNLVFLIDTSGSMQSPHKLPLVKESLRMLVRRLREEDRVALVTYAGSAGLVLPSTSGADRGRILEAIDRLEAGGSTAGGAGLRLAYDVARRHFREGGNNRVILATDGDFNVGESSDAAMQRLVEQRREEGTWLTVLGFGTGNLQSAKMQTMAQHGNGNYAYIDGLDEARKVLVDEMGGTLVTVAKDVKVQIEFDPRAVRAYRLLGYENRLLADEDFNDDRKDAGEVGAGHTVTALYEIVPVDSDSQAGGGTIDPLRYQSSLRPPLGPTEELAFVKVRYKAPEGVESTRLTHVVSPEPTARPSDDLRFASAVAGFGMLLRQSEYRGSITAEQVLDLAESAVGEDADGSRGEFLELVHRYRILTSPEWTTGGSVR